MPMKKSDFEQFVFLKPGSEYRRALMLHVLAYAGISWETWSNLGENVGIYYTPNDIFFACLYANYKASPTAAKFLQLGFMLMPRNKREAGYMIDPVNKDSAARKAARIMVGKVGQDRALGSDNFLKQVYSEMWLKGASLNTWAAGMPFGIEYMRNELEKNKSTISENTEKKTYFETLRAKFCGEGIMSTSSNKNNVAAFDAEQVGMNVTWQRERGNAPLTRPNFLN